MHQLMTAVRVTGAECWWWLRAAAGMVRRFPRRAVAWLLLVTAAVYLEKWWPVAVLAAPVAAVGLWARLHPVSFERRVSGPWWRRRLRRWLRAEWPTLVESCGLARRVPGDHVGVMVPALVKLRWTAGELVATPRLLMGQTVDDVQDAADRLRVAAGARRVRVLPDDRWTGCRIVWSFGDPLAQPFNATVPAAGTMSFDLAQVTLERTEDGTDWVYPFGASSLFAGASGSGKASLIWCALFGIAPAIRAGVVQVHGVDLKGGMELSMGRRLFTRYATTPEQAVVLLEDAATALQERAARLAGHTRQHTPTAADPLVLVLVDELAALIAYLPDRDLTRRAEAAMNIVLSQGRAVGYCVFGFVQDPRKETVKNRNLFIHKMGLRLAEREEVAMVLGEGAIAAGALCHRIPVSTPGVGYFKGEDGRPVKVRAGYVSDQMISTCAARFPAPYQVPIVVPEPAPGTTRRRRTDAPETPAPGTEPSTPEDGAPRGRRSRARSHLKEAS